MSKPVFKKGISYGFCSYSGRVIHSTKHCFTRNGKKNPKFSPESIAEMLDMGSTLCLSCWEHQHPTSSETDTIMTSVSFVESGKYVSISCYSSETGLLVENTELYVPSGFVLEYRLVPIG